jgi:hypothetical protein
VLAVLLAEFLWLTLWGRRNAIDVVLALAPGALMLMAVRAALTGLPWYHVSLWLAASLPVHLADLRRRRLV